MKGFNTLQVEKVALAKTLIRALDAATAAKETDDESLFERSAAILAKFLPVLLEKVEVQRKLKAGKELAVQASALRLAIARIGLITQGKSVDVTPIRVALNVVSSSRTAA